MSNFEGSFGAARARLTAGNRRGGVCVFATSCGRWHFYKLAVIRQESQACFATPLSGSLGSQADSAKVQRMYVFNGCSRFGERGRNRTFNLLIFDQQPGNQWFNGFPNVFVATSTQI